jgi:hypothetical protein
MADVVEVHPAILAEVLLALHYSFALTIAKFVASDAPEAPQAWHASLESVPDAPTAQLPQGVGMSIAVPS